MTDRKSVSKQVAADPPAIGRIVEQGKLTRDDHAMVARLPDGRELLRWREWEMRCAVREDEVGEAPGVELGDGCRAAVLSGDRRIDLRSLMMLVPLLIICIFYVTYDLEAGPLSAVIGLALLTTVAFRVYASGQNHRNWLAIFDHGVAIGDHHTFTVLPWDKLQAIRVDSEIYRGVLRAEFVVELPDQAIYHFEHAAIIRTPRARRLAAAAATLNTLIPPALCDDAGPADDGAVPQMPGNQTATS